MIRKKPLHFEVVYDHMSYFEQYDEVRFQTTDRKEAIQYFLELSKKINNDSLILPPACNLKLVAKIDCYIRERIGMFDYKEDDLNEALGKIEKKLTTSYETFRYLIKFASGSMSQRKYEILFETEDRLDALEKFLNVFRYKKENLSNQENIPDIFLEVAISPFDVRCLYLKFIQEESEIFRKLTRSEKDLENIFSP